MRELALEYARSIHAWRDPKDELFRQIHDALQLTTMCGQVPPPTTTAQEGKTRKSQNDKEEKALMNDECAHNFRCIYVSTNSSDNGTGSLENPIGCLHKALNISRSARKNETDNDSFYKPTRIILRQGIHVLYYRPLLLSGSIDSDLEILAYPGEDVWISGGMAVPKDLSWKQWGANNSNIWVTDLSNVLGFDQSKVPSVFSLFSAGPHNKHQRFVRSRYPNGNPELNQWGYISPDRKLVSIRSDVVLEWQKPEAGVSPTFDYILLDKTDSTMDGYNMYASGHGGVCETQWGPNADSYWCSNYSQVQFASFFAIVIVVLSNFEFV